MKKLLRLLLIVLCDLVYSVAVDLFSVFYRISATNIFKSTDTMQALENIYNNVYTLISLIMLFAFAIKLIQAIVNPDLLSDQKKGVGSIFKRAIIGMGLIVATPFLFKILYDIQGSILRNNTIQKLIIGQTIDVSGLEDEKGCRSNDPGQMLAGAAIYAFLYPTDQSATTISVTEGSAATSAREYTNIITCNVKKLDDFTDAINDKQNGKWSFHFDGLCALGMGILLIYYFIIFCMDAALRLVKLIFLQLIAPVIISAYILTNDDTLIKYLKEVGSTFAQVFVRIASISFLIFIIANINSSTLAKISDLNAGTVIKNVTKVFNPKSSVWFDMFIIIGALQFVKIAPDLIGKLLGVSVQNKGGIKGRLGDMAAVGGLAQKAWSGIQGVAGLAATAPIGLLGKGVGFLGKKGIDKIGNGINSLTNNKTKGFGHAFAGNASRVGSGLKGAWSSGSFIKGASGFKKGWDENKYKSESDFNSSEKRRKENGKDAGYNYNAGTLVDEKDENGKITKTVDQFDVNDIDRKQKIAEQNMKKNSATSPIQDDITRRQAMTKRASGIVSAMQDEKNKIVSELETQRSLADAATALEIDKLIDQVKDSKNASDLSNLINNSNLSDTIKKRASSSIGKIDKLNSVIQNDTKLQDILKDANISITNDGISLHGGELKGSVTQLEGLNKSVTAEFDIKKKNASAAAQAMMDENARIYEIFNDAYLNAAKKYGANGNTGATTTQQATPQPNPSSQNNQQSQNNQSAQPFTEPINNEIPESSLDLLSDIQNYRQAQEYKNQISSIESQMAEIEGNDYNYTSNPKWMNLNTQKETANANLEKIGEIPTYLTGESNSINIANASQQETASGPQYNNVTSADNSTVNQSQQTNNSVNTDNSDIISALNKINESVTNNTTTLGESINSASTKISDTTRDTMRESTSTIIENMNTISRKSTNIDKANAAANSDSTDDNYDKA